MHKAEEEKKHANKEVEELKEIDLIIAKKISKQEEAEEVDHKTLNQIYPEVTYTDVKGGRPPEENLTINLVIIGHVDSGKSTLAGHLLYQVGCLSTNGMRKMEKLSDNYGKSSFKFAYVMD